MSKFAINRLLIPASVICLLALVFTAGPLHAAGGTADRVIGQIDFTKNAANFVDGRGLYSPSAVAVDPVGGEVYVADTSNNRVLGWKSAAEFQGNQPADIVIGQPDFNSYYCNQIGGNQIVGVMMPWISRPARHTLCNPDGVAVDRSGNVYVSDAGNNRVLVYSNPFALLPGRNSNFNAMMVFGQGSAGNSFTTDAAATGRTGLSAPEGIAVDSTGNLFVLDTNNNRALEYFDPLSAGNVVADRVFGQTDFSRNLENQGLGSPSSTTLSTYGASCDGLATDSYGNLYLNLTDSNNHRVLEYNGPFLGSDKNDPGANLVLRRPGFQPTGVTIDESNTVYIASYVAIYEFEETTNPPSNAGSAGWVFVGYGVLGLGTDASKDLFVAHPGGNRTLEYLHMNLENAGTGTEPDAIEGQANDTYMTANFVDGRGLGAPGAVAIDESSSPNHIYVLDQANNRVLGWKSLAEFTDNQPADLVVGQADFFGDLCGTSAQNLCLYDGHSIYYQTGGGITVDRYGNLFVADVGNNRVLEFSDPFTKLQDTGQDANFAATIAFGGGPRCNMYGLSAQSLCLPTGVAFDPSGNLYIADAGNNRVLQFKPDSSGSFASSFYNPSAVFGQGGSFSSGTCNNGYSSPSATTLCGGSSGGAKYLGVASDGSGNLYIADYYNNRVLEFTPNAPGNFGTDPAADLVFGQGSSGTDFTANVCDGNSGGTAVSRTSLCLPVGITTDPSGNLYVADGNSRVLEYDEGTQPPANVTADRVFGQRDFTHSGCNNGNGNGSASAASLCFQNDLHENGGSSQVAQLATDALGHLYVADIGNNRVIEFDSPLSEPTPTPTPTPMPTPTPPSPTATGGTGAYTTPLQTVDATSAPVQVHLKNPNTSPTFPITLETDQARRTHPRRLRHRFQHLPRRDGSRLQVLLESHFHSDGPRTAHGQAQNLR